MDIDEEETGRGPLEELVEVLVSDVDLLKKLKIGS